MDSNESNLGYLINKASRLSRWELNKRLSKLGITSAQWSVLRDVYFFSKKSDVELTPAAIAERLNSDRPTISGIIERLVKMGMLLKLANPKDGRSQIIQLTSKGEELMPVLEAISNETIRDAAKGFSREELELLNSMLLRVINNFS